MRRFTLLACWEAWQLLASQPPSRPGWLACSARWHLQHHKRKILRATGASNLLRGSHQAASMHIANPRAPRAGCASCARSRRSKHRQHRPQHQRRSGAPALRISGKPVPGSFSGTPAGRGRSPEGPVPGGPILHDRQKPCKIGQHIWAGCLKAAARLALGRVMRSLYRSLYMRAPPPRCASAEAEERWRRGGKRRDKAKPRTLPQSACESNCKPL